MSAAVGEPMVTAKTYLNNLFRGGRISMPSLDLRPSGKSLGLIGNASAQEAGANTDT